MGRLLVSAAIEEYVTATGVRESPVQQRLRAETARLDNAQMQIGPDQGAFLALLVRLLGARRTLEIGTFTGYSTLCVASALPDGGQVVACDVSDEWTGIARRYWQEAGVTHRIDLRLGPALDTLRSLSQESAVFDFALIDADKPSYDAYYEACLLLVRPGGLIAIDNALWSGAVADPEKNDPETAALRALNLKVRDDPRVQACLLTINDGMLLAQKKRACN